MQKLDSYLAIKLESKNKKKGTKTIYSAKCSESFRNPKKKKKKITYRVN